MALTREALTARCCALGATCVLLTGVASCGHREAAGDAARADTAREARALEPDTNQSVFWSHFRTAVTTNDTGALLKLVARPLETRGPLDGMPWIARDSTQVVALLDSLLNMDPGLQGTPSTMRELVRHTIVLDSTARATADEFRVGDFVFQRVGGEWRFARAYMP